MDDARFARRPLSLDCLSLTSCSYAELIQAAAAAGFDWVSLWLNPRAAYPRQVVSPADRDGCVRLLSNCGVGVRQVEAFDLVSPEEIAAWRPLFELGAAIGAKTVLFYNSSVAERATAVEFLQAACEIAGACGLSVNLEPVSFGRTRTLGEGQQLIEDAGVDAGLVFDLLHHVRAGGTAEDLRAIDHRRIRYVQVNDGLSTCTVADLRHEAMAERLYPGRGEFPIAAFLAQVPDEAVIAIEAPSMARATAGIAPARQAQELMDAFVAATANLPR